MSQVTELLIRIKQQGDQQLTRLQGNLKSLAQQTSATNVNFKELSEELRKIQNTSTQSINNLRGYANTWREIANSVDVASNEFKQANAEAAKLEAQLKRLQPGGAGRFKGIAQGVGTVAAAGVFGGPLGALGAVAGAPFGVAGMAAGGAIGAQAGMMGQQVAGLASYTAGIEKQRIALKLITQDAASYQQGLDFIYQTSQRLAIPQELITRQFTQLSASVIGAGGNVKNAEKAFLGIAAGIRGTGGSLEDLDAALRATAQVFSKGKVSAEELRQQIGERLPGAFTLFAKSIGMTPKELDKALEDGRVTLQDFMKFAEELFKQYGKNAEIIARGPQSAGDRLQASLSKLSESVGRLLAPIGAAFQTIFADIVAAITRAANALARFFGMKFYDPERIADLEKRIREQSALVAGPADSMTARRRGVLTELQRQLREERSRIPKGGTGGGAAGAGFGAGEAGGGAANQAAADREAKKQARLADQRNDIYRKSEQLLNKIQETTQDVFLEMQLLGGNAFDAFENKYTKAVRSANKETEQLLLQVFNLAKAYKGAGGDLNVTPLVRAIDDLNESQMNLAAGDAAQKMSDYWQGLSDRFMEITDQTYAMTRAFEYNNNAIAGLGDGLRGYADNVGTVRDAMAELSLRGIKGVEDSIVSLMVNGTYNFREFAVQILEYTTRMIIQQFVLKSIMSAIGFGPAAAPSLASPLANVSQFNANAVGFNPLAFTGGFGFAMGGIMTGNGPLKLRRYAAGGIASGPQLAMFGEGSRPEAYVPLPDGRTIPVTMKNGAGGVNVNVNVDAGGSSVEGDGAQANQLGKVIGIAVQQELIKQKRPGGLLA